MFDFWVSSYCLKQRSRTNYLLNRYKILFLFFFFFFSYVQIGGKCWVGALCCSLPANCPNLALFWGWEILDLIINILICSCASQDWLQLQFPVLTLRLLATLCLLLHHGGPFLSFHLPIIRAFNLLRRWMKLVEGTGPKLELGVTWWMLQAVDLSKKRWTEAR